MNVLSGHVIATTVLFTLSGLWLGLVSKIVPEPYLDEIFHIPQAQAYCNGLYSVWDDKLTTPPGLYLYSLPFQKVFGLFDWTDHEYCGAATLRATNIVALIALSLLALWCREEIQRQGGKTSQGGQPRGAQQPLTLSSYSVHTAFNIGFFPLLFFFSGLYYTDVVSTAAVLLAYLHHLRRINREDSSVSSGLLTVFLGVTALWVRQTNIFWVVVYIGGLEAVSAVKGTGFSTSSEVEASTLFGSISNFTQNSSLLHLHDPPMFLAWSGDLLVSAASLAIAIISNPVLVLKRVWPHLATLVSFMCFVAWNGGVVLGDKSNHVATIHLTQMLYIWPLLAFFSFPLLVPFAIHSAFDIVSMFGFGGSPTTRSRREKKLYNAASLGKPSRVQPTSQLESISKRKDTSVCSMPLRWTQKLFGSYATWLLYVASTMIASVAVVRYNTIVHPFTLADNRHYMFYIFRYTIRRASWIKYALIVPYTICRWTTWGTMAGGRFKLAASVANGHNSDHVMSSWNHPFRAKPLIQASGSVDNPSKEIVSKSRTVKSSPVLSTSMIWLLATTFSLTTAPLVEPRYFIIPWVIWRLHVPAWQLDEQEAEAPRTGKILGKLQTQQVVRFCKAYDLRLVGETLWFLAINVVTGYIFLTRPYQWKASDGTLLDEGRLQRFMW